MSPRLRAALLCPLLVMLFGCTPPKPTPVPSGSPTASASPSLPAPDPSPSVPAPSDPAPSEPAPSEPAPTSTGAPEDDLWPYPKACLETTIEWLFTGWYNDETTAYVNDFRGTSRPCAGQDKTKGVRLAVTQYHLVDGRPVGWMGTPWQTNSIGSLGFSRTGDLPAPITALCLSTGLVRQGDAVHAEHNRCIRPLVEDGYWGEGVDVPVDDPSVSVALERWPAPGEIAPPGCRHCFLVDPATTPSEPYPTSKGPIASRCAQLQLDTATIDANRSIDLQGSYESCVPGKTDELYLNTVRYTDEVGDLGRYWESEETGVQPFARGGTLLKNEDAICIITGIDASDDGLRGHHALCLAVERDATGALVLVRIPVTDSRVTLPVDTLDDGSPGGPCATCL
jgi:hypothetical protein